MQRPDDPRLGSLECQSTSSAFKQARRPVGLIQVPCDEGVSRNGGRVGAAKGPGVVMELLSRFGCVNNCELGIDLTKKGVRWAKYGSTDPFLGTLDDTHRTVSQMVRNCLRDHIFPLCIGGGNDQSWANGSGWIEHMRSQSTSPHSRTPLTIVNVDAHLDVRPLLTDPTGKNAMGLAHSGSPFRQLVEYTKNQEDLQLIEFGAQGQQCAAAHVDYVLQNSGRIIWLSQLRDDTRTNNCVQQFRDLLLDCQNGKRHVFFSFDIDAIRASDCPGVSCPSPVGLTSEEALELCYESGRCDAVEMFDISEFNPTIESDRTSRLVVNMIYHFFLGYALRGEYRSI